MKLSATIITYNEEKNIKECIDSIKDFCDEIVVVDSNSDDDTTKIAKSASKKVKVYKNRFKNYADQKNFAAKKANGEWIFSIDADERVDSNLKKEIIEAINSEDHNAYSIPRRNFILGAEIKYTRWQSELDRHIWLFKKSKAKWVGDVHEEVVVSGSVGILKSAKLHYQDKTITEFLSKLNKYSNLDAEIKYKNSEKYGFLKMIIQVKYNFFVRYFYRLGFLDGWRGFVLSYLMAYYQFQVWVKLWHFQNS